MNTSSLIAAERAVAPPSERMQAAIAALQASRAALRQHLIPPSDITGQAHGERPPGALWRNPLRKLRRLARRWPVTQLASQAVQRWWQANPWRDTGELLAGAVLAQARPFVRRHPLATVAGVAALGAVVVAGRPWRWPLVNDQLRPVPGRVSRWVVAQLGSAPVQTALAGLLLNALLDPDVPDQADSLPASSVTNKATSVADSTPGSESLKQASTSGST